MSSYLFTSRRDPMLCVVSDDPTGESLPAKYGPWDRTEVPWDGEDAGLVAGIREMLEEREVGSMDDGSAPPAEYH
jgi:hypothetical protein